MKKVFLILLGAVLASAAILSVLIRFLCDTPYGRLDPRAAVLLNYIKVAGIELVREGKTLQDNRRIVNEKSLIVRSAPLQIYQVNDMKIPGPGGELPVRVYRPGKEDNYPAIMYYHGGGFYIGNLETHDNVCRRFAIYAGAVVISVDYRLAPEHPFPAAIDDGYAALEWVKANAATLKIDPARIAVAGDSAGGNISLAVSYLSRERKGPKIACQVLIYPGLDFVHRDTKSYRDFADGYFLTNKDMDFFLSLYAPKEEQRKDPLVSPYRITNVKNLPPTVMVTAGFDVLRDEGEAFAERLKNAGVPVLMKRYEGLIHGFIAMDRLFPQADEAVRYISVQMKKLVPSWDNASRP